MEELNLFQSDVFVGEIDVSEDYLLRESPKLLMLLLKDRTTQKNILWGTKSYESLGKEYKEKSQITPELITGSQAFIIRPRIQKELAEQRARTKRKAEVFTPIWIVKKQNDLADENFHTWSLTEYLALNWLEITCGEAPYMASRYDTVTGETIPIANRVGFVDRKLQRINQEINEENEWLHLAKKAYQASYGYEFQGDSLLLARENLLYTFIDYYLEKFGKEPSMDEKIEIAKIVSYNVFQMDGLKYIVPLTEEKMFVDNNVQLNLFGEVEEENLKFDLFLPGIKVKIKNWENGKLEVFETYTFNQGAKKMKFDVVIGNPPFDNNGGINKNGSNNRDEPLYHILLEEAYRLSDICIFITPGRFLFNAGQTPKRWNEKMLNDEHLKVVFYEENGAKVFPNTGIKGGVAITYRDADKVYGAIKLFNTNPISNSILNKVKGNKEFESLKSIVYSKSSYKYTETLYMEHPEITEKLSLGEKYSVSTTCFEIMGEIFYKQKPVENREYIQILGRENKSRIIKWTKKEYISGPINFSGFKVALPAANGKGEFGEVLTVPFVIGPNVGHTQTFMTIGNFDIELEAESLLKYVKSKFIRALLGTLKVTQHNSLKTWANVPLQNFTTDSDIDWSKSIAEIDQQLYKKYNLSTEEIDFIETKVKEMV